jgi:hypothetical protein
METFAKFFTGTTGVIFAIALCSLCFLIVIGVFCFISGGAIISISGTPTP